MKPSWRGPSDRDCTPRNSRRSCAASLYSISRIQVAASGLTRPRRRSPPPQLRCLSNGATPRYLSHRNSAQFPTNICIRKHNYSTWNNCDRGYAPRRPEAALWTAKASPNCSTWNNLGGPDAAAPPREAIARTASPGHSSRYTQRQLTSSYPFLAARSSPEKALADWNKTLAWCCLGRPHRRLCSLACTASQRRFSQSLTLDERLGKIYR